jgi:hypothetical protein
MEMTGEEFKARFMVLLAQAENAQGEKDAARAYSALDGFVERHLESWAGDLTAFSVTATKVSK